MLANTADNF